MFLKLPILVKLFFANEVWGENLVWLRGISGIAIALTDYFVSLLLIYGIYRREDRSFTLFLWLLTVFLLSGGTIHIFSLANIWQPHYWFWGYAQVLTAIIALIATIWLFFAIPQVGDFPSSQQIQHISNLLTQELDKCQSLDCKISNLNTQLEQKIDERTAELKQVNQKLTTEIEERKQIESALYRQIQLEQLIGYLSHCFVNIAPPELSSTIQKALNFISKCVGVDRSYLILFTQQNNKLQVTQKWSVPEFPSLSEWEQEIESKFPWIMTNIKSNVIVNLPELDHLPTEAERERVYLTTHQIQSLLIVPLFYGTTLKGIVALEALNQPKSWTERDTQLLKLTGEIIAGGIERCGQAAELANRTQQLEASNAELQQFAYIVSHDLLEPLRSISGFSYLLQEEYQSQLNPEAQEYIDFIKDGAARMRELIEDLLTFSRLGRQNLVLSQIDCEEIIQEVIANLAVAIAETNAEIHWVNLPNALADRTQFIQLWQNLIANAIKFRNPKSTPKIYISATQKSQELIFTIRDNGIGIDSEYTEDIFNVFRKLHNHQQYPGTGIGLAICRRIADLHGGRIWVKSIVGKGSTFYVSLPIQEQQELGNEDDN